MSRDLAKLRHPPVRLQPGQEWWTDYRWQLAARLREDVRKGRVEVLDFRELAPGFYGALVRRLKSREEVRQGQLLVAIGATLMGAAALAIVLGLLKSLLDSAGMFWPFLLAVPGGWVIYRILAGHRVTCVGLHCSGCQH